MDAEMQDESENIVLDLIDKEGETELNGILEDMEVTAKMEEQLIDLQNILEELQTKGAVNKTLAIAIESVSPGLLGENLPTNGFTSELSKTNYSVTVEGVVGGILNVIKFILRTIGKIIGRMVDFVRKLFYKFKKSEEHNKEVLAKTKVLVDEIYNLRTAINSRDMNIYTRVFKEQSAEASQALIDYSNNLFKDVSSTNVTSSVLVSVGKTFNKLIDALNSKMSLIEKTFRIVKETSESEIITTLSNVNLFIKTAAAGDVKKLVGAAANGTISNDFPLLKDAVYRSVETKSVQPLSYQTAFDNIKSGKMKVVDDFISNAEYTEANLEALKKKIDGYIEKAEKDLKTDPTVANHLKDSLIIVRDETASLMDYIRACNKVCDTNRVVTVTFYNLFNKHYKILLAEIRKSGENDSRTAAQASWANIK